ncbi:MAG: phosphatidate cytidylyltransferase [Planctomycetes bacterium]|nr:phosphatidate cytidylyltransferase [Planctomycetota bacterium]
MLKYRLIFGSLMAVLFTAIIVFDGWLDGSLTAAAGDDKSVQATLLCILVALLMIPAQLELAKLAKAKNLTILLPVTITASILFATSSYWLQMIQNPQPFYFPLLGAITLLTLFLYQYFRYGTSNVLANCGVSFFSIMYLGLLSGFVVAIRTDFGLWALLMFIFTIKSSDIGAYTVGKIFGKHKFAPKISPGKTWEGMAGAAAAAAIVAVCFAINCDIIKPIPAAIFGLSFAFIGQFGDLAESMIKRDCEQKDSANNVPGFGGILDIIDSPLVAAPFGYLFFMLSFR